MNDKTLYSRFLKAFGTVLLAVAATVSVSAQGEAPWIGVTSSGEEFSAEIPPETIIINEDEYNIRLFLSSFDVRIDIRRGFNRGPKDIALRRTGKGTSTNDDKTFELGKMVGRVNVSDRPGRFATVIDASSSGWVYFVAAYGRRSDDPKVLRFLASVKFGGKPLLNITGAASGKSTGPTKIDDLKSSDIVKEFLKKPMNKNSVVRFGPLDSSVSVFNAQDNSSWENETRSLIVIKMPLPVYRPNAYRASGAVTVIVTLLSTGMVGDITVDSTVDRGLAESAAAAARQIKFIPAEVGGKPVDVRRKFIYGFSSF